MTLGSSDNLICFKNISTAFNFSWINAPFEPTDSEKIETINIDQLIEHQFTESWKTTELTRLADEESQHFTSQLQIMQQDLNRIKTAVIDFMNTNELEPVEDRFPIQFFNLNATEADIQSGALKEHMERERKALEQIFSDEKSRIENIKQIMWDCFQTKPQKLLGIFTDIFIQNFPLTDLDEKLSDELILKETLDTQELFDQVCEVKPWIHPNIVIKEVIDWPVVRPPSKLTSDRFSLFAMKIIDQQLTANVNLDYNFFSTLSIESESIDINNEALVNAHNLRVHVSTREMIAIIFVLMQFKVKLYSKLQMFLRYIVCVSFSITLFG